MQRIITIALLALALSACAAESNISTQDDRLLVRKVATPTSTPTVGYQATAMAAQSTADASMRLLVQATAEYEARIQQQLAWTATAQSVRYTATAQAAAQTATAAGTSIPLTATAQVMMNHAINTQQAIMITAQAMTQQAPTMLVAMERSQLEVQYMPAQYAVNIFAMGGLGAFLFAISIFIFFNRSAKLRDGVEPIDDEEEDEPTMPQQQQVTLTLTHDYGGGFGKDLRLSIPCTPVMLTEFADGVINNSKSLGVNNWEGRNTEHWTRSAFSKMRSFMQSNKFVMTGDKNNLVLTDDGRAFLLAWLNDNALPHSFNFATPQEPPVENAHGHDAHEHEEGFPLQNLSIEAASEHL